MTFTRVTAQTVGAVETFMRAHSEFLIFPLNNLAHYGLDGEDALAPRIWCNGGDTITDVISVTKSGNLVPYLPSGDFAAAARALSGHTLRGLIGNGTSVRGLVGPLGLTDVPKQLETEEGHFVLQLADTLVPDGTTELVPLSDANRAVVTEWLIDYHVNALLTSPAEAHHSVPLRLDREQAEGRRVVLMDGDVPVMTTAFSAALPYAVQVGGVYTPPEHRGKGYARRALALHLQQAQSAGAKIAVLSADLPSAIAAYTAIGFRRVGDWSMVTFAPPLVAP